MTVQRAIGYVRISDDRDHDAAGVNRQQEDVTALAERLKWTVMEIVVENDTSAWKRRLVKLPDGNTAMRVVRPGFRRALEMLMTGVADGFLAYDLDRVARDPRDLEDLIDCVVARSIPTQSVTGSLDLSTDSGILAARINVAVAHKSSQDTSRRVSRKHEELARTGRYGGGGLRPFGYEHDGTTIRDDEAHWVRWMCAQAIDGMSMSRIARELDSHGVKPPQGGDRWNARSIYTILTGPRIVGLRRFRGKVIGEAHWPALVDRATFDQVRVALDARRGNSGNTLSWWCVGLLWCHRCQQALVSVRAANGNSGGRPRKGYRCPSLHTAISPAEQVQDEIQRQVLDFLSQPNVLARLRSTTAPPAVEQARRDVADLETQLDDLAVAYGNGKIKMGRWLKAQEPLEKRLRDAQAVLSISVPTAIRALVAGDIRDGWETLDPHGRRDVALTVQPQGWRVDPAPRRGPRAFNPARLVPIVD
ncbi:MAG: recombinase family protein [Actinoallomurus sp.]